MLAVFLWRLLIVACALTGFVAAVQLSGFANAIPGLSQQASLLTALVYLGLAAYPLFTGGREPRNPWPRGATAVLLLLVAAVYAGLMGGDYDQLWSVFEHIVTPLVVLLDWILVGRNQGNCAWWQPLSWVVFPLAYLVYFLIADPGLYGGFLDPDSSAFPATVGGFLLAVLVCGYLLYVIAMVRTVFVRAYR
ncbi:hypothetical protein [Sciscionella sediminilitoris]|uniref:hypothetical protein n=1 Tax=Sciscionella sediminilitoris TaxID=1445613 RepID=UPI001E3E5B1F|nr:hypothetical protein [Sciscionella sp. SE31]